MPEFLKSWFRTKGVIWAARLLTFLSKMVKQKVVGFERVTQYNNVTYAHWHGDELALLPRFGHLGTTILVSHSKDGEMMANAAEYMGYNVTRGSSTRGAVGGLVALIKAVKAGHSAVLAVDGPQGPRGICKPGIIRISQKTNTPLFPVGVAVTRKFVFKKTWNQAYLPLPFARQAVVFRAPLVFEKSNSNEDMERFCRKVEEELNQARIDAESVLQNWKNENL